MSADAGRARYLADAVATATPARRIVLLYDRLWLDIQRAQAASDADDDAARDHLMHAQQILAELLGSLDTSAWAGAAELASLYAYLLSELIAESGSRQPGRLGVLTKIVSDLRSTWQQAEQQLSAGEPTVGAAVRVG